MLAAAPAAMVLAGAGIAGAVQAAAPERHPAIMGQPSPDADLIAHCAQLDALERAYLATDFEDDGADVERQAIAEAQFPFVDAICAHPPRTLPGFVAVARSLALWDAEAAKDYGEGYDTNERLLSALLRGLTGRAAA